MSLQSNKYIYGERPMLIYWELTRSCELACRHCRAEANNMRHPLELKGEECLTLLKEIKEFGAPYPQIVVTGGDPLNHPDWLQILAWAKELGIGISFAPSATHNLTPEVFRQLKEMDVQCVSLSLDGASPETHDSFRGVDSCFDWTMKVAEYARETGMPIQINTLVSENTIHDLEDIYNLISCMDIIRWSVFFLISVGRGTALRELSPDRTEEVLEWITSLTRKAPFQIKTTEAPHYRRVVAQKISAVMGEKVKLSALPVSRGFGIRDGNGILFISHIGDVNPSGFLPLKAGNVRKASIVDIYRNNEVFTNIRNPENYSGKCGICEYRYICGGSRARAFAGTGDYLGSDPLCSYQPVRAKTELIV